MPDYNCVICGDDLCGINRIWVDKAGGKHLLCVDCSSAIMLRVDDNQLPEPELFNKEYWSFPHKEG